MFCPTGGYTCRVLPDGSLLWNPFYFQSSPQRVGNLGISLSSLLPSCLPARKSAEQCLPPCGPCPHLTGYVATNFFIIVTSKHITFPLSLLADGSSFKCKLWFSLLPPLLKRCSSPLSQTFKTLTCESYLPRAFFTAAPPFPSSSLHTFIDACTVS